MTTARIMFGQLLEDQPGLLSPGILTALNLYPKTRSYGPFKAFAAGSTNALTARCLGGISARDTSNNVYVYAGDAAALYEQVEHTFTDESKGGGYSTAAGDVWEFAHWSYADQVLATNFTDAVQFLAVGGGASGAFADLITSTLKPKAKHIAVVWPAFVVLGNTSDGTDGHVPNRLWWSAYRDAADFDPDASTQCDFEDLATGGAIQAVAGMIQYGLVFQTGAIRAMQYQGPGVIFNLPVIDSGRGTPIPNSVMARGRDCFFINEEGFFAVRDGGVHPIGDQQVDKAFWAEFDVNDRQSVSAAIDPINKVVAWAYPGEGSTGGLPNRIRMCKWDERRWSLAEVDTTWMMSSETQGYTLEGLDNLSTDMDGAVLQSLDSDLYKGGLFRFAAFDRLHQFGTFIGPNLGATIETGDIEMAPGKRALLTNTRPLVDGGDARIAASGRSRLIDGISYPTGSDLNIHGECPQRVEGRYHRLRCSLSASTSWSHVIGIEYDFSPLGKW